MEKSDLNAVIGGIVFEPQGHTYTAPDGHRLKGVTTLMGEHGLGADYSQVDRDTLTARAAHGTAVHKLLEDYDNGRAVVDCPELASYKKAMEGRLVIASEYLISNGTTVASSIDKVLSDGTLVDVKTTSKFEEDAVSWQLSIYAFLFEMQNPGTKVPALFCCWFKSPKDCRLLKVKRHPDSEVQRLLDCDAAGEIFIPDAVALPDRVRALLPAFDARERAIAAMERTLKKLKDDRVPDMAAVYEWMEGAKMKTFEYGGLKITRVDPIVRNTFDTAWLKRELPDLYEKHMKSTTIAGTVRVTVNEEFNA